ncbi:MAG: hypothetical protein PF450_02695 [Bacteroidales bacterium]|jgi:hypothetical protein|nr:hypothetical protein [Bacteroidales bacterium]
MKVFYDELIKSLPAEYSQEIGLNETCQSRTLVILDDDPTGCQTVHDVPVLFSWEAGQVYWKVF